MAREKEKKLRTFEYFTAEKKQTLMTLFTLSLSLSSRESCNCGNFSSPPLMARGHEKLLKISMEREKVVIKSITQECNELHSSGIKVIWSTGILQATRWRSHLQLSHMCISSIEHCTNKSCFTVSRNERIFSKMLSTSGGRIDE